MDWEPQGLWFYLCPHHWVCFGVV